MELNYSSKSKFFILSECEFPCPDGFFVGAGGDYLTDNIWIVLKYRHHGTGYAVREITKRVNLIIIGIVKSFSSKDEALVKKDRDWAFYDTLVEMDRLMYRLHEVMFYTGKWKRPLDKNRMLPEIVFADVKYGAVLMQEGVKNFNGISGNGAGK